MVIDLEHIDKIVRNELNNLEIHFTRPEGIDANEPCQCLYVRPNKCVVISDGEIVIEE